ncbi:MAG: VapE domain-containing protein, partial [Xenococcaceae cyanobacterium]
MSNFLTDAHLQEWLKSGVSESLIRLNVKSVSGDSAYSHLLYSVPDTERRNDGRLSSRLLHRYRHLDYGGWWFSGIDVLTGKENEWGCLKPDRPRTPHQKNKPLKYEHPEGVSTDIFAFQVPDDVWDLICEVNRTARDSNNFWQWVAQHPTIPIFITEGAKKAAALLSAGYVAIGLPGVNNGSRSDGISHALIPQLTHFSQRFREFVFAFDRDKKFKTRQMVTHATLTMGRLFQELGSKSTVLDWDARFGKGIDDVIFSQPEGFLDELIDDRLALAEYEQKGKRKAYYLDSVELVDFMEGEFEDRFSFDEIKGEVLLDGEPLVISAELKVWFIKQFGYRCSTDDLLNTIAYMAKQNRFNPVQEYLKSVRANAERIPINNLADRYFGATHPIYSTFIKKWLIGAVARAFSPGCQMDYCLVLKGEQRIGKSSFFQVLGGPWFDDSITDVTKEDSLLILYSCWIQELAELENVTTKRAAGEVKPFITRRNDRFRQKYDREISEHPRRSVLCATVNKTSFLADDTGNTRFLIVPIPKALGKLNKALFVAERDGLWASAVDAYFAGEKWELTLEEEIFSEQNNKMFDIPDEWESNIEHYLSDKEL